MSVIYKRNIKNISKNKIEEDDINKPKNISLELGKLISKKRNSKKITQKEFAIKINENFHVINDYESGKAIPNKNILTKMEKVLEIKLTGKNIGSSIKKK